MSESNSPATTSAANGPLTIEEIREAHELIAEYIINFQPKALPSYYTTAQFWSQFGEELLAFRVGDVFEELDASGQKLGKSDESLLTMLQKVRSTFCKDYDIPPAPITPLGQSGNEW